LFVSKVAKETAIRLALTIEYEGTRYHGFQYQDNASNIQEELENSIYKFTGEVVRVKAAGRTDSGVHAIGQVISFDTVTRHKPETFVSGLNHYLPEDIAVREAFKVPESFDPRRDAVSRVYKYTIRNSKVPSPLQRRIATEITADLDVLEMKKGASLYLGTHDFRKFSGPMKGEGFSSVRKILRSHLVKKNDILEYTIEGNAFLSHQVRRMVGALVDVGRGALTLDDLKQLIRGVGDSVAHSLPAQGLCLREVRYERFPPLI